MRLIRGGEKLPWDGRPPPSRIRGVPPSGPSKTFVSSCSFRSHLKNPRFSQVPLGRTSPHKWVVDGNTIVMIIYCACSASSWSRGGPGAAPPSDEERCGRPSGDTCVMSCSISAWPKDSQSFSFRMPGLGRISCPILQSLVCIVVIP